MSSVKGPAIQDLYSDDYSHCFGCGRDNPQGHRLNSFVEGDEVVAHYAPAPHDIAVPGFVYGGLLASLADCHGIATAAAAAISSGSRDPDGHAPRFVTAALRVDFLKPTPLGPDLEIRGHVTETSERKAIVAVTISADGVVTVRAEVVAVRLPKTMSSRS